MTASRVIAALALASLIVGGVAGCASEPDGAPSPTPSESSTPTSSPAPTTTAQPVPQSIPLTIGCDELVTPQAIYDFNPNYGLDSGYKPAAGSFAGEIASAGGLACSWVNQTSGETIRVAVEQLPEEQLTTLKNTFVTTSTAVPTFGAPPVEGYFHVVDASGEAQVFSGPYWISAASTSFYEPGDAEPIVSAARSGLGE